MTKRVHNFYPGPAALPLEVLEEVKNELLDYKGIGASVMEISHRSPEFKEIVAEAQKDLLALLDLNEEEYFVFFLANGATHQFSMLPMNICKKDDTIDYIISGKWSERAHEEGSFYANANIVASSKSMENPHCKLPEVDKNAMNENARFLHFATNNTIYGTQWWDFPKPKGDTPLVSDMSSDFLSRTFDASKFSMIYAGAQKNIGPAGITVAVIKKSWLKKDFNNDLPKLYDYNFLMKKDSAFNTPPVFNIYFVGKVFKWIRAHGGIEAMEIKNRKKSEMLYNAIDSSEGFYRGYVKEKTHRSWMNVTFNLTSEELEKKFLDEAKKKDMIGLKGYRTMGGIRVSMYNAISPESVEHLVTFMEDFRKENS